MNYTDHIRTDLATTGNLGINPRHVEAFMRLEYGTLDALSPDKFTREVKMAAECVKAAGPQESEGLASSYGL
jgi:hypothetical protein